MSRCIIHKDMGLYYIIGPDGKCSSIGSTSPSGWFNIGPRIQSRDEIKMSDRELLGILLEKMGVTEIVEEA